MTAAEVSKLVGSLGGITKGAPLRLDIAARIAYPDGSMSVSGLRREAARGRLVIERVAGKDYTTLQAIEEMRTLCRLERKGPGFGSAASDVMVKEMSADPHGSSLTTTSISPRDALRRKLQQRKAN
jgi:hypothetical protein